MGDGGFQLARVDRAGRHVVPHSAASADGRDEGDLVALRHGRVPVAELLVDRAADRIPVRLEGRMLAPQGFIHVRERRTRGHLEIFRFQACLLAQSREQPDPNSDRYRHKAILDSDRFASLQREGEQRRLPGRQAGSASYWGPPRGAREGTGRFPLITNTWTSLP